MTTTKTLQQMTPPAVDAELADLSLQLARVEAQAASAWATIHTAAGDEGVYKGRNRIRTNKVSHDEARATVEAALAAGERFFRGYLADNVERALAAIDACVIDAAILRSDIGDRNAEWSRRGCWSRFFLVTNHDGHIHRDMACSTCHATTQFNWLPTLSGLTEADAVAAHGPLLCSVCFPSAPVEWTVGKPKAARCEGSGKYAADADLSRYRPFGTCPVCGEGVSVNRGSRTYRAHKPKGDA